MRLLFTIGALSAVGVSAYQWPDVVLSDAEIVKNVGEVLASAERSERNRQNWPSDFNFQTGAVPMANNRGSMFYYHVPAESDQKNKPLLVFVTGPQGLPTDAAVFTEMGPYVLKEGELVKNSHSLHKLANVLYVDTPIGTGFSSARNKFKFNQKTINKDFGTFMEAILEKYPEYENRDVYLMGESFNAHFLPSMAVHLMEHPVTGLNLKGVALQSAWLNPAEQYPAMVEFAHQKELISDEVYPSLKTGMRKCAEYIEGKYWPLAETVCHAMARGVINKRNPFDYTKDCKNWPKCAEHKEIAEFLNDESVRQELDVVSTNQRWTTCGNGVFAMLTEEYRHDAAEELKKVGAAGKKVLLGWSDRDFIANPVGGEGIAARLSGSKVNYHPYKTVGDLSVHENWLAHLRVKDAGHVPSQTRKDSVYTTVQDFLSGDLYKQPSRNGNQPESVTTVRV